MSTKGRIATDFSGIVGAAGADIGADTGTVGAGIDTVRRLVSHRRSAANPAIAKPTTHATTIALRFVAGAYTDGARACAVAVEAGVSTGACIESRAAETSFGIARAVSLPLASNQCDVFRKYSKSAGNGS